MPTIVHKTPLEVRTSLGSADAQVQAKVAMAMTPDPMPRARTMCGTNGRTTHRLYNIRTAATLLEIARLM